MMASNSEVAPSGLPKLAIVDSNRRASLVTGSASVTSVETEKTAAWSTGLSTFRKKRMAARFSNSRNPLKLPLLSNSIAIRTGVSARLRSLMVFGCPSIRSSKSSSLRFVTATPRTSTTLAGTGTRYETTRTTSSASLVSWFELVFPEVVGFVDFDAGRGRGWLFELALELVLVGFDGPVSEQETKGVRTPPK